LVVKCSDKTYKYSGSLDGAVEFVKKYRKIHSEQKEFLWYDGDVRYGNVERDKMNFGVMMECDEWFAENMDCIDFTYGDLLLLKMYMDYDDATSKIDISLSSTYAKLIIRRDGFTGFLELLKLDKFSYSSTETSIGAGNDSIILDTTQSIPDFSNFDVYPPIFMYSSTELITIYGSNGGRGRGVHYFCLSPESYPNVTIPNMFVG
jgi:hypothetical protein